MQLTPKDREDLRSVILGYLAARNAAAFDASSIRATLMRRRAVDFPIAEADVTSACQFLTDKGLATRLDSDMGSSIFWRATDQGVVEAERRGLC